MNWIGGIGIFIVVWAVCLFLVLPWGARNQSDAGEVIFGTEPGAPVVFRIWWKLLMTTVVAFVVMGLILWGVSNPVLQRYWH